MNHRPPDLVNTIQSFPHDFPFDPTYGFDLPRLEAIAPPPPFPGFEAFWREAYAGALAAPLAAERSPCPLERPGYRVEEVSFLAADGLRIGGWLMSPLEEAPRRAIVVGHGYGGREAPDEGDPVTPTLYLYFCARGFHRSAHSHLPDNSARHVIHGIQARETYILRGCALDLWAATGALLQWAPELAERLYYNGGSFGGGLGALAVPWDARIKRCHLRQPTFGNHPFRLQAECRGSGESVRLYSKRHPEVIDVLRYFDAATTAAFMTIPALVSISLFDPAVPPPGQFSVYNAIPSRKERILEPAGHFDYPAAETFQKEQSRRVNQWFS